MNNTMVTIKVQDGCSQKCGYCLVRKLRGKSISLPYSTIVDDIKLFSDIKQTNHICICGINTLEYQDESIGDIVSLMKQLLIDFPDMTFELDNINPFNEAKVIELIDLIKNSPNIVNKLCISIQSVSDKLLMTMHRPYTQEVLRKIFSYAKENNVILTTEIIVGFPGETEEDVDITYKFLKEFGCDFIVHVFSPRPETEAIDLPNQVPENVVIKRMEKYKELKEAL